MAISLNDINGNPISLMGTGNSMFSQGTPVNAAQFSSSALFGKGLASTGRSATTPAATSITRAGSTANLGFTDPLKSKPGAGSGGQMNPVAPSTGTSPAGSSLTAPKGMTPDAMPLDPAVKAIKQKWGPQTAPGEQMPSTGSGQTPTPTPSQTGRQIATGMYNAGQKAAGRIGAFAAGATEARDGTVPGGMFSASGVAEDTAEDVG